MSRLFNTLLVDIMIDNELLNRLISVLDELCENICSYSTSFINHKIYLCGNGVLELFYSGNDCLINIMCKDENGCAKLLNEYLLRVVSKNKVLIHIIPRGIPEQEY